MKFLQGSKREKRTIIGLIVSILALTMFTIGMTFAYFTATSSSTSSSMQFGTLEVVIENNSFGISNEVNGTHELVPGCTVFIDGVVNLGNSSIEAFVRLKPEVEITTWNGAQADQGEAVDTLQDLVFEAFERSGEWLRATDNNGTIDDYVYYNGRFIPENGTGTGIVSYDFGNIGGLTSADIEALNDAGKLANKTYFVVDASEFGNEWQGCEFTVSLVAEAIQAEHVNITLGATAQTNVNAIAGATATSSNVIAWTQIASESNEEPSGGNEVSSLPYLTFSCEDSGFTLMSESGKNWDGTLEYSTDATTWTAWTSGAVPSVLNESDSLYYIYLRGTGNSVITGSGNSKSWYFTTFEDVSCSGNIENLLDYQTVANGGHPVMADYCFNTWFNGCTKLVTAPELPSTTLSSYCYSYMFGGCTKLTSAPELPATTLADFCYFGMFSGCTGLTSAPELPATTLADRCYLQMFYQCSSLVNAPALPATTLANECYEQMFMLCSALVNIPELPATTLVDGCYFRMFATCGSLKIMESDSELTSEQMAQNNATFIFHCPDTTFENTPTVMQMFVNGGGTFTGAPTEGKYYYWYTE